MKEKKTGFTLIELLAVIVILAIIALIATPIVLNLINKSRKGSAKDSAFGVKKAAQLYYQTQLVDNIEGFEGTIDFECKNGECSYTDTNSEKHVLELDGTIPETGHIKIDSEGNVTSEGIVINGYNCLISSNAETICLGNNDTYNVEVTLQFATAYNNNTYTYENEIITTYGSTVDIPFPLTKNGYNSIGWDLNGDGVYNAESDTLNVAIMRALAKPDKKIQIDTIFELKNDYYEVTVINGSGSGTYQVNDSVNITVNEAPEGKKFSHWLQNGEIISYNESQSFLAYKNIEYEAVYVDEDVAVDKVGITTMIDMYKDLDNQKLKFISLSTVPSGYTINKAGVIVTDDASVGNTGNIDDFTSETASYTLGNSWTDTAYRYTLSIGMKSPGAVWYVRAYLQYTDLDGVSHTIYGNEIVSQTM